MDLSLSLNLAWVGTVIKGGISWGMVREEAADWTDDGGDDGVPPAYHLISDTNLTSIEIKFEIKFQPRVISGDLKPYQNYGSFMGL